MTPEHGTQPQLIRKSELWARLRPGRHYRLGRTIAILIDENAVQLATAHHGPTGVRLLDVTRIHIPLSYESDVTRSAFIIAEVTSYLKEHARSKTHIILGITGNDSVYRVITLPNMSKKELPGAIYWEANRQIPFKLDQAYYDYRRIKTPLSENKESTFAVTAIPRRTIATRLEQFQTADIKIDAVHHELEAIGQFLPNMDDYRPDQTYVLVNVKGNHTDISYYDGNQLSFIHTCSIGAQALNAEASEFDDIAKFAEALEGEVQNSLDYYAGLHPKANVETAYVYGSLAYSEELIDKLTQRFGIAFKRFPLNTWVAGQSHLADQVEIVPTVLGAIALAVTGYRLSDFLPHPLRATHMANAFYRHTVPIFAAILVIMAMFWLSSSTALKTERAVLDRLHRQVEQYTASPSYRLYRRIKRNTAADRAIVNMLESNPTFLHLGLKELSRITPQGVVLDHFELLPTDSGYGLQLMGRAIASDPPPEVILAEFVAQLEHSPFFNRIDLRKHDKRYRRGQFVVDFQIEMRVVL
ncbi:MAG: pilus assembly protein PilM [candidate division Zixibacteria bacterium]|nr:pilus assembly protein PilM [candidate division Zixibacteria bacterium]